MSNNVSRTCFTAGLSQAENELPSPSLPYSLNIPIAQSYAAGEYGQTVSIASKAVDKGNTDVDSYFYRGRSWQHLGRFDKAQKDFTRALEIHRRPDVLAARSILFADQGRLTEAEADYLCSKEQLGKGPLRYLAKIKLLYRSGSSEKAYRTACKAVTLFSTDALLRIALAEVCTSLSNKYNEACNASLVAANLEPRSPYIQSTRAFIMISRAFDFKGTKLIQEAKACNENSLQIAPDNLYARISQARLQMIEGNSTLAVQTSNDFFQKNCLYLRGRSVYIDCLLNANLLEQAKVLVELEIKERPGLVNTWEHSIEYHRRCGDEELELRGRVALQAISPHSVHNLIGKAKLFMARGSYDDAKILLDRASTICQNDANVSEARAMLFCYASEWNDCLAWAMDALSKDERLSDAMYCLAVSLLKKDKFTECLQACDKFLSQDMFAQCPLRRLEMLYIRGMAKLRLGIYQDALDDLRQASAHDLYAQQCERRLEEANRSLRELGAGVRGDLSLVELESMLHAGRIPSVLRVCEMQMAAGNTSLPLINLKLRCLVNLGAIELAARHKHLGETLLASSEPGYVTQYHALCEQISQRRASWWRTTVQGCQDLFYISLGTAGAARILAGIMSAALPASSVP